MEPGLDQTKQLRLPEKDPSMLDTDGYDADGRTHVFEIRRAETVVIPRKQRAELSGVPKTPPLPRGRTFWAKPTVESPEPSTGTPAQSVPKSLFKAPPVEAPPIEAPPVEAPPIAATPIAASPVEAPPIESPRLRTAPPFRTNTVPYGSYIPGVPPAAPRPASRPAAPRHERESMPPGPVTLMVLVSLAMLLASFGMAIAASWELG
ncbi:MAG: hypothetical protein K0V04_21605 [Deltaproteobacteria bacterium]|nr:hypothetical protein [Deltaproteobacteria bacterium]